jgi:hypothetical protein
MHLITHPTVLVELQSRSVLHCAVSYKMSYHNARYNCEDCKVALWDASCFQCHHTEVDYERTGREASLKQQLTHRNTCLKVRLQCLTVELWLGIQTQTMITQYHKICVTESATMFLMDLTYLFKHWTSSLKVKFCNWCYQGWLSVAAYCIHICAMKREGSITAKLTHC